MNQNPMPEHREGPEPAYILAIKPNYAKIRKIYFFICLFLVITTLMMQVVMFINLYIHPEVYGTYYHTFSGYFLIYSSLFNIFALMVATIICRTAKNEIIQNFTPIGAMIIICSVSATVQASIYSVTMPLVCIPIIMVSIYGQNKLNFLTAILCAIGLLIAILFRWRSPITSDIALRPEAIMAFIFLIIVTIITLTHTILLNIQKSRLIKAVQEGQAARKEALEANQAKSDFLANMSHEIRTPLNAVVGLTEMIMRESTEKEIKEYAADIQQASNLLLSIINDILDISKIESGKLEIKETRYELGSLINDSYNMVVTRIYKEGLTVNVTCDPKLPRLLYGDEYHMRQILVNLLSNAAKYTHQGGIELNVYGVENNEILHLDVKVKDTGIGIREEDMQYLFGKFTRLELNKNRHIEGSGLGLSITKQLVELMGGSIDVESVYGVGSTFIVRIPQKIADHTPIGDIHSAYLDMHGEIEKYQQSFEAPNAHILVVDDVPINLRVINKLLEATKIKVDTANSGKECLKKIVEKHYDIILMDHMMPEMDGVETLKAMNSMENSKNLGIPVIMLTANAMVSAREQYLNLGFTDYLAKPVRGAKLEKRILQYLPKDKVQLVNEAEVEETSSDNDEKDLSTLLPELDIALGLSYCADDMDFYNTMLLEYASEERTDKLKQSYNEEDWKLYQVEVHSMKSASRMVGLAELSDEFMELEQAAKNSDVGFIKANHDNAMEHYNKVVVALNKALSHLMA